MFKKTKNRLINQLEQWVCGKIPVPKVVVEERKLNSIDLHSTVCLEDTKGLSNKGTEIVLLEQMMPEIKKYMSFEIKEINGVKYKHAYLKVVFRGE